MSNYSVSFSTLKILKEQKVECSIQPILSFVPVDSFSKQAWTVHSPDTITLLLLIMKRYNKDAFKHGGIKTGIHFFIFFFFIKKQV